ncbi:MULTISPECIES: carboxymuconolactone decarboxylase family protein [unclassified Sphingomonas]|uniref:carboxymuconolactone decarboxylase family protein n=1 Tax=unclassified Sphingomonas TaxID=196159 RepID=UPI0006FE3878|nr:MULTISPECIES: carboxymuconolactone decarboxylase family protein [unclassified Sphingomonas]KQX19564.1 carboxymuconolactone decarboxylase [Sphingomonas sp. Root1294]KQY65765.1 carboxymuconolactone decarboxylase [Sphingomonas sp. Root50]KRB94929.1 carboxymuconolactone decarboxylase [Sphingomonas sp. Root720]
MPDTLLSRVPVEQLPEDFRRLRESSIAVAGDGDRLEVFGNHPALYRWYQFNFYGAVFQNGSPDMVLDQKWKELIRLKLSLTNGCFVCNAHNVPAAAAAGYSQAQIDAMDDENSPLFTPQEQAVLALGRMFAIANPDPLLSPELYGRLSAYFSDAEILELGFVATILSGWTKLIFAYDLVTRECPIGDASRTSTPSQTHLT